MILPVGAGISMRLPEVLSIGIPTRFMKRLEDGDLRELRGAIHFEKRRAAQVCVPAVTETAVNCERQSGCALGSSGNCTVKGSLGVRALDRTAQNANEHLCHLLLCTTG